MNTCLGIVFALALQHVKMDNAAETYDRIQGSYQGENGLELIDKLALRRGSVVLDLGCGTGYLSSVLAERVGPEGRVVGVDPNTKRLEIANQKYGHIDNLQFTIGSSENFPSGAYDVVFANQVIQWIENKESTFKYVYQNFKVGGKFAFLCPADSASCETVIRNFESVDDIIMWALATMDTDTLKISPKTINDVKKGIEKPELQWKKIQFIMTKSTYTE